VKLHSSGWKKKKKEKKKGDHLDGKTGNIQRHRCEAFTQDGGKLIFMGKTNLTLFLLL
jgi:hypothetical protein